MAASKYWSHYPSGTFEDIITCEVGAEKQIFTLHKSLATESSEFFKAAASPQWNADGPRTIKLHEEDTTIFKIFVSWIYTNVIEIGYAAPLQENAVKLSVIHSPWSLESSTSRESSNVLHLSQIRLSGGFPDVLTFAERVLIPAYMFGVQMLAPKFCNAIISTFCHLQLRFALLPSPDSVALVFDNTMDGDPLRNLVVRLYVCSTLKEAPRGLNGDHHPDFISALSKSHADRAHIPTKAVFSAGICSYHRHKVSSVECSDLRFRIGIAPEPKSSFGEIAKIRIGNDGTLLYLHRDRLPKDVAYSPDLETLGTSMPAVGLLFSWKYNGSSSFNLEIDPHDVQDVYRDVIEAYSAGMQIRCLEFCDGCINIMLGMACRGLPSLENVELGFSIIGSEPCLHNVIAHIYMSHAKFGDPVPNDVRFRNSVSRMYSRIQDFYQSAEYSHTGLYKRKGLAKKFLSTLINPRPIGRSHRHFYVIPQPAFTNTPWIQQALRAGGQPRT